MTYTREDLAWVAGIWEGEGCFFWRTASRNNYKEPCAAVTMTDEDVVRKMHAILGFGSVREEGRRDPRYKRAWRLGMYSHHHVQALVALIWPWLGDRRKAKAKEIMIGYNEHTRALNAGEIPGRFKRRVLRRST